MTNPDALRPFLHRWGLPEDAELRLVNVSENATFEATAEEGHLFLRLHRTGYHTAPEIASELAWLAALRDGAHTPCAEPRPARDGSLLQTVALCGEPRHVVAFTPIAGREPAPTDDLANWFGHLGAITARLHGHARAWIPPCGFTRKRWDGETILGPRPHWGDWRDAPDLDPEATAVLSRLAADIAVRLLAYGTGPERFGLVHADLRLANLLIDGSRIWAIDFDDCGFSWWMYDFAAAVSFIEDDPRLPDLACLWSEGYRSVAPLTPEDFAILPTLVMLRRLLLTAWLGSRADSDTARSLGGPAFTKGTICLADRFLSEGPARFWR